MNDIGRRGIVLCGVVLLALAAQASFEVYFLRHGQTDWNLERRLQGSISHTKLTAEGRWMADETGRGMSAAGLRFDRVYTSPYDRAKETAERVAAQTGPAPVVDSRLREMCFGDYEGQVCGKGRYPDENLRLFFEDAEKYVPKGERAESFDQVQARLREFLEKEIRPLDGQVTRVLCVTHSLVLKSLVREFAGSSASADAKRTIQPNCCVHVVRFEDGKFSLRETGKLFYPELRVGVLGDVHLAGWDFGGPGGGPSVERFRRALRYFDSRAVDGVVIAGDLTHNGEITELKRLAETWREIFPEDRRSDGGRVERLFAFGDHDVEKPFWYMKYRPDELKKPEVVAYLTTNHIAYIDRAKVWRDAFHEDFQPIVRKTVKGYDFILAHLVNLDEDGMRYSDPLHIPGLEEFFETNSFDRVKPFFYVQHKIPKGTVGGPFQSGQDSGRTSAILSRHPNAVGFNGHKHRTATEELSLWQGAFTQIQAPGLASLLTAAGRENSKCSCEAPCSTPPQQMEPIDSIGGGHAMVVSVYRDRLVIERVDICHGGEPVAAPWTVPWPNDGSAAYERRGAVAPVPRFAADAKVSVAKRRGKDRAGNETDQVVVSFPTARAPRAYDYEVTAVLSKGVVTRIVSQKRVYSPRSYWPERYDTNDVVCVFGRAEIPDNHDSVRFVVRPMNAWGEPGEPIESKPCDCWPKGPLYPW